MSPCNSQAAAAVVMVRPQRFRPNPETALDNAFQRAAAGSEAQIAQLAYAEHSAAVAALRRAGVTVHLFEDDGRADTPDSVFPNNWFSCHPDGSLLLYPMRCISRRRERRGDVLDLLRTRYRVRRLLDLSGHEQQGRYLEGTGAMVCDHQHRQIFMARSARADEGLLDLVGAALGYQPLAFDASDAEGRPIYHSNVLMCVASGFAMVGLDWVAAADRQRLCAALQRGGRDLIELSPDQIANFAGNALELATPQGPLLALSARALASLRAAQRARIERHVRLLPLTVPTLELAGGSVRCMLAGVHLPHRHAGSSSAPAGRAAA